MRVRIEKSIARGKIKPPYSKSIAHRLLIAAALSEGKSVIHGISRCEDVLATIDCLKTLGITVELNEESATVYGKGGKNVRATDSLNCRESGSSLRFFVPIAMLSDEKIILKGMPGLMKRPMTVFEDLFSNQMKESPNDGNEYGQQYFLKKEDEIEVCGPLKAGDYTVPGDVSSQFITGLLFALPLCEGDSCIHILNPVESRSYLELTIEALSKFSVDCHWKDKNTIVIKGNQSYQPGEFWVEADASGAAFLDAFNFLGGAVEIQGLPANTKQGDAVFHELFEKLDKGMATISLRNCPDLGPVLFALAAAKKGAVFTDTKRLKMKESDRVSTMVEELQKFGSTLKVMENQLIVEKSDLQKAVTVLEGHGDHRIVMALSVLLSITGGEIEGAEAVAKSYPGFFEDLLKLGIKVELKD